MKTVIIILVVAVALVALFQIYTTMAQNKTEEQAYKVVLGAKDFEIRFYPAATVATITSSAKSYRELGNSGFGQLAGYIFGGNEAKQQIAMTSPVHMDINDAKSSMSFVMPSTYNKENLPKPTDSRIIIQTTTDEYVAAIKFGGFASDKTIKLYAETLENALKANKIAYFGNFRFLGYNPPYQLFGRRNEIIINVKWDSK
jgi:hypothetical protein